MKTLFASFLIALTTNAFATSDDKATAPASFQSSVYVSTTSSIRVAIDKEKGQTVQIRLVDEKGRVVATESIAKKQSQFRGRFDVNKLPDGHYTLEITDGTSVETRGIDVATNTPTPSANRVISLL
ncbi:T9SS type A sorting domain-containing protein [Spirosoma fluminis]